MECWGVDEVCSSFHLRDDESFSVMHECME